MKHFQSVNEMNAADRKSREKTAFFLTVLILGDSLSGLHVGANFSTHDKDYDANSSGSCATLRKGAWWYSNCAHSNLNGYYYGGEHSTRADGVNWYHWRDHYYSLRFTEMKIRPTITR